ncbi:MAG: oligosaccharide flippase family protein [Deltaproteobacteria bacterium]|nr:oligosaccharide flippase family protein [Deltaproteobacteria bacterium]
MNSLTNKFWRLLTPTKANFLWMMLGNGIYALCQWGMLVVLAKLGSPEVVGRFALATAIVTPVIMITNMQLRSVQATDAKHEYHLADYISVRIVCSTAALIIILAILGIGNFEAAAITATLTLTLAKFVESLSDVFYGFFQQHEKMSLLAKSMILKGALSVLVLGIMFFLFNRLPLALIGLLCAWMLVLILYDWRNGERLLQAQDASNHQLSLIAATLRSLRQQREVMWKIIKLAFPLGIVMGIISLNTNIPIYAIEKFLGSRELGIFAALAYTTVAVNMFIQALGQAVSPRLARAFAEGHLTEFKRIVRKMTLINFSIGLTGVLIVILGGEPILTLIYTAEYGEYATLFLILMVSATLLGVASAFGYAMTAARQFKMQVPLFTAVLVSTSLTAFLLIPHWGLYGAAFALITSALIQIIGSAWIVVRALRFRKQLAV